MRVIFMGTPQLAVPVLRRIIRSCHEVVLVVTQPDKQVGRRQQITPPPVKQLAIDENIPVLQPLSLKDESFETYMRSLDADIGIVFAYGKIIPQRLLDLPKYGMINIHASLLPRWRGAAPIQRAIMAGDKMTGVTIMQMAAGLDTGDILLRQEIPIESDDTSGSITEKMSDVGAELLIKALDDMENGIIMPQKQDDSLATYADKITDEDPEIDWGKPATVIDDQVRGLNPKPGAYTYAGEKILKIWRTSYEPTTEAIAVEIEGERIDERCEPGTVMSIEKHRGPLVATGDGLLLLEEVQPENKKKMTGAEYVRGYRLIVGDRLGMRNK